MTSIGNAVASVLRALILVAFLTLIAAVLIQITTRLFFPRSPVWTEELSRFALLYLVAIGGGLAIRTGDLVNVDLLINALRGRARVWLLRFVALGCVLFAALLVRPGWQFTAIGAFQTSPTLGISMTWIFAIVIIAPLVLVVFALEQLVSPPADPADRD